MAKEYKFVKRSCADCTGSMYEDEENPELLICITCGTTFNLQGLLDPNVDLWGQ